MEPIITLPYSEWMVAERLMKAFPSSEGYSVYAPLSRQEKGVDLLLARRSQNVSRVAALQVKYSRAYEPPRGSYRFAIWFRSFPVPDQADFFVLAALYPNVTGRGTGAKSTWWSPLFLLFRHGEMTDLLAGLRTRAGRPERMFYFGFDTPDRVVLTRGAENERDFSEFTLERRLTMLKAHVSGE